MKKDRNSFFSGYGYGNLNNPNGYGGIIPNQTVSANSQFYVGPANQDNNMFNNNMYSDIDSRLSKIERSLSRLESRVNKLEGDASLNYSNDYASDNSMYMI